MREGLARTPPRYRVEHQRDDVAPLVLARTDRLPTAHVLAGLHRGWLDVRGGAGTILIVDAATGAVLKRYPVAADGDGE